jgi:hypothetical protein
VPETSILPFRKLREKAWTGICFSTNVSKRELLGLLLILPCILVLMYVQLAPLNEKWPKVSCFRLRVNLLSYLGVQLF